MTEACGCDLQGSTLLRYRNGVFEKAPSTESERQHHGHGPDHSGRLLIAKNGVGALAYRNGRFEDWSPARRLCRALRCSLWPRRLTAICGWARATPGCSASRHGARLSIRTGPAGLEDQLSASGWERNLVGRHRQRHRSLERERAHFRRFAAPASPDFQALAMTRDRDGNLWVGTDSRGLAAPQLARRCDLADRRRGESGPRQAVTAVFEDREGNLWIGGAERPRASPRQRFRDLFHARRLAHRWQQPDLRRLGKPHVVPSGRRAACGG